MGLARSLCATASSWTSQRFYKCLWKRSICDSAHKELRTFNAENVPQGAVSQPLWGEGSQNGDAISSIAIHITLEPKTGRPVSLARVCDPEVLRQAARAAIDTARRRAVQARNVDELLGGIRGEEADQLERYLAVLIPGLNPAIAARVE